MVLSALVVRAGDPISTEALADALWGDDAAGVVGEGRPGLRRAAAQAARARRPSSRGRPGYRLTLSEDELDHRLFERLLERAREALAGGDPARASYLVAGGAGPVAGRRWRTWRSGSRAGWRPARLEGLRMDAEELRVEAEIARRPRAGGAGAGARAGRRRRRSGSGAGRCSPPRCYQAGRQAEALGALKRARAMLVDELGLDPGPRARRARAAAAAAGPVADPAGGAARSAPSAPTAGCCPTTPRTPTRSSAGRTTSRRACGGCATRGVLAVVGPVGRRQVLAGPRRGGRLA